MAGKSSEIRRKSFEVVNQKPSADDLRTKMPITLDDRKRRRMARKPWV